MTILSIFVGCAAPAKGAAGTASFVATRLAPPAGAALEQACTPTGPELCFNAVDDNCNGVIDEGCGLQTGLLQFTIAWGSSPADVNLLLTTPGDDEVPNGRERSNKSGFHIDRDCPGDDGCGGQNVENIYFDGAEPPRGEYKVEIALVDLKGAESPVHVHFGARLGSRTVAFDVNLSPSDGRDADQPAQPGPATQPIQATQSNPQKKTFTFVLS